MEKITAAATSHGKPSSAADQTAKSPADHFSSGFSWKQVVVGGAIPRRGKAVADPSAGPKTSVPTSSAPMKNPPPPEPVSPAPEHPKAADFSQKSNNTPKVLEPSSSKTSIIAGSSSDSPVLEPSSSTTELMAGSSGDSAPVSSKSRRRWSRRRGNRSSRKGNGRENPGEPQQNSSTPSSTRAASSSRGPNPPIPMIPQGIGRGFVRSTPLGNLPFMVPPPPVRPFGCPPFFPYRAPFMHFIPAVPAGFHPSMPFHRIPAPVRPPPFIRHPALLAGDALPRKIMQQIDYYFSEENLFKDGYLKSKMDNEGWVPVSLVAGFPRIRRLTTSIPLILDSMRGSYVVEVKDDKLRKRHGWRKWATQGLPFPDPVAG